MDFPIHVGPLSMELPIVYLKGSQVEISKKWCISVHEGCFNADPEMHKQLIQLTVEVVSLTWKQYLDIKAWFRISWSKAHKQLMLSLLPEETPWYKTMGQLLEAHTLCFTRSKAVPFCWSFVLFMPCVFHAFASVINALWPPAGKGLTSWLLFVFFKFCFCPFRTWYPECQVWNLIVSIPDLCRRSYFVHIAKYDLFEPCTRKHYKCVRPKPETIFWCIEFM